MSVLIAGGSRDPNLAVLIAAAERLRVPYLDARHDPVTSPRFRWSLDDDVLLFDSRQVEARGAFLRVDVFAGLADPRPEVETRSAGWHAAVSAWLLAHPAVRLLNRDITPTACNKPAALAAARRVGLPIPPTVVTNDATWLGGLRAQDHVSKPVTGGDYCVALDDILERIQVRDGCAAMPSIVQQRLVAPELRIYVIGRHTFAFDMVSGSLDYRIKQDVNITLRPEPPASEAEKLRRLMDAVGMDFGAADLKTDPQTGQWVFLELNTSPMFARFDFVADGRIADALLRELCPV